MSDSPSIDPHSPRLHLASGEVHAAGEALRQGLLNVRSSCRDDVWQGALATEFIEQLDHHQRQLDRVADDLEQVVRRLALRALDASPAGSAPGDAGPPTPAGG